MSKLLKATALSILTILPTYASSNELVMDMISYIEQNSKYVYNGEPLPVIEIHPAADVCRDMYTEDVLESMDGKCNVAGYYNDVTNTIVISDDPGEYMVQEKFIETVLFHELVHFLQFMNGEDHKVECLNALEWDAFVLQNEFIEEMGYPEQQKSNMLFAIFVSSCNSSRF